jgi:hypothetical protein
LSRAAAVRTKATLAKQGVLQHKGVVDTAGGVKIKGQFKKQQFRKAKMFEKKPRLFGRNALLVVAYEGDAPMLDPSLPPRVLPLRDGGRTIRSHLANPSVNRRFAFPSQPGIPDSFEAPYFWHGPASPAPRRNTKSIQAHDASDCVCCFVHTFSTDSGADGVKGI